MFFNRLGPHPNLYQTLVNNKQHHGSSINCVVPVQNHGFQQVHKVYVITWSRYSVPGYTKSSRPGLCWVGALGCIESFRGKRNSAPPTRGMCRHHVLQKNKVCHWVGELGHGQLICTFWKVAQTAHRHDVGFHESNKKQQTTDSSRNRRGRVL